MRIRTLILLIALCLIALFAALNWTVFTTPTTLSLGVTDIQAPLGLVMLVFIAVLTALFLVFVITLQTSVLLETRRQAKELQASKALAEQAEASRYTELRAYLATELTRVERDLHAAIEASGNTLAAYIGELEDRLSRK